MKKSIVFALLVILTGISSVSNALEFKYQHWTTIFNPNEKTPSGFCMSLGTELKPGITKDIINKLNNKPSLDTLIYSDVLNVRLAPKNFETESAI